MERMVIKPQLAERVVERVIAKVRGTQATEQPDLLAVEEPLEIRLGFLAEGRRSFKSISVTMRTPGDDFELAAGFLFTEGILHHPDQIVRLRHCGRPVAGQPRNIVRLDVADGVELDWQRLERHFYTSSSCGVCGKSSIAALQTVGCPLLPPARPLFRPALIHALSDALLDEQALFARTGGLHAAALFAPHSDPPGTLLAVREDVGRHNAVDKLIGAHFLAGRVPLHEYGLLVSGRASFELVQKALMAGIPLLAAVGAPSSLAVELAAERGMTLLGFVRGGRFNIYTGGERIVG